MIRLSPWPASTPRSGLAPRFVSQRHHAAWLNDAGRAGEEAGIQIDLAAQVGEQAREVVAATEAVRRVADDDIRRASGQRLPQEVECVRASSPPRRDCLARGGSERGFESERRSVQGLGVDVARADARQSGRTEPTGEGDEKRTSARGRIEPLPGRRKAIQHRLDDPGRGVVDAARLAVGVCEPARLVEIDDQTGAVDTEGGERPRQCRPRPRDAFSGLQGLETSQAFA